MEVDPGRNLAESQAARIRVPGRAQIVQPLKGMEAGASRIVGFGSGFFFEENSGVTVRVAGPRAGGNAMRPWNRAGGPVTPQPRQPRDQRGRARTGRLPGGAFHSDRRSAVPEAPNVFGVGIRAAGECRGAGNQNIGAGGGGAARGLEIDSAIDF